MNQTYGIYKKLNNPKLIGAISLFVIAFIAFGYPIQVGIPAYFQLPSRVWNVSFRAFTFFIGVYLILIVVFRESSKRLKVGSMAIIIFWIFYLIRLVYDVIILDIKCGPCLNVSNVFSFAIGQCFIGALVGVFTAKYINLKKAIGLFSHILLISLIIIFIVVYKENGGITIDLLFERKNIGSDIEDEFGRTSMLNVSYFGIYGTITALLIIFKLFHFKYTIPMKIWNIIILIFSIFMTFLSGSRSPILIFIIILIYIFYLYIKNNKLKLSTYLIFSSIFIFIFSLIYLVVSSNILDEFSTIQRFINLTEASKHGKVIDPREMEWASAWNQFLSSPIIGDQIVTTYDYFYPHNIYLEVIMSLGILGGIVFIIILYHIYRKQRSFIHTRNLYGQFLFVIVLYVLMDGIFGQSLWGSPYNWVMISFFLNIKNE